MRLPPRPSNLILLRVRSDSAGATLSRQTCASRAGVAAYRELLPGVWESVFVPGYWRMASGPLLLVQTPACGQRRGPENEYTSRPAVCRSGLSPLPCYVTTVPLLT